jgi:hypothetical protein
MKIPSGKWYSGADLGFNALVIPLSTSVDGVTVPWAAGFRFSRITFLARCVGAVINITLKLRVFDLGGVTQVSAAGVPLSFVTGINNQMGASIWGINTPQASAGAIVIQTQAALFAAPFARFHIQNLDAVNPVTVTLTAILHREYGEE